jgi:large subunit ribosomal protein L17
MLRNMSQSLIEHGQIKTSLPRAKELVRFIEPLITLAKKGTLHARRLVISRLNDRFMANPHDPDMLADDTVVQKLFNDVAPTFKDRNGGYTRVVKTSQWKIGDATDLVIVQLVGIGKVQAKRPAKGKKKAATPA